MRNARTAAVLAVTIATITVGLGGAVSASTSTDAIPAPKGLPAFYSVPKPLPTTQPGALIKSEKVAAPNVHGTVYRVMYVSKSEQNKPVAVTGLVLVPKTPAPKSGYPVVTWGHGTNGMADQCAPSLDPNSSDSASIANLLLDKGYVMTASDYEGEGTPGLMPYIAGESAARNTIDIVRAARHLPAAHAGKRYLVWGHSEGGQTAMFGLHIAKDYAPELEQVGTVAGAPPSQFNLIYTFLQNSPYRYYLLMAAGGLNAAYGDKAAPLDAVLTPKGMSLLPLLDKGCSGFLSKQLGTLSVAETNKTDPFKVPTWQKLLEENDPQSFTAASPAPLLIIQGGNDEQIPVASTKLLADHLCSVGQDLERWIYPGQTHAGVIAPSAQDMLHWIGDRFAGQKNPDPYVPTGNAGIEQTTCP